MPVYLVLNAAQGLPNSLAKLLLSRPNTTLVAAIQHLTPDSSKSLSALPKHTTSSVIPAKIDLYSQYDAAGVVRGLMFAGITRVDGVIVSDYQTATANSQYADGALHVFRQFQTLLATGARLVVLERGDGHLSGEAQTVLRMMETIESEAGNGNGNVIPFYVDREDKRSDGIVELMDKINFENL